MNRRDIFRALFGLIAAPFVAKAASASTMPQIGDPWPGGPILLSDCSHIPSFSIMYFDADGREQVIQYVAVRDAIPTGDINGFRTFRPGPIRYERKDVVDARLKYRREVYAKGFVTDEEIRRMEAM